ncbi:charged multivesicular body protein 6-A-like isoform X2 [Rhodnius prolixus]|uniref:Uncharacterized protein n=1 Tax=Rhodnius prolixus TaxID=13249 RepID=T1IEQ6_RHOPR
MGQSSRKHSKVTKRDIAILKIKCLRDAIKIFLHKAECIIRDEKEITKKLLESGQREKVKSLLRRKLILQNYLNRVDRQLENMETIIFRLESSLMEHKVIDAIRVGNAALKNANNVMNIKYIKRILLETSEGIKKQMEIDEQIAALQIPDSDIDLEHQLEIITKEIQNTSDLGEDNRSFLDIKLSFKEDPIETTKLAEIAGPSQQTVKQDEPNKKRGKLAILAVET